VKLTSLASILAIAESKVRLRLQFTPSMSSVYSNEIVSYPLLYLTKFIVNYESQLSNILFI